MGDFVNRGPDSAGVLRLLRQLGAGGVLGNHDVHLLRVAAGLRPARRNDTFHDVLQAEDGGLLLAWLRQRPFVRALPGLLLVHAGLHPAWEDPEARLTGIDPLVAHEDTDFATSVRYCKPSGKRPPEDEPDPGPPFRPWFEYWEGRDPRTIVFGHWAKMGLVHRPGLRGLDTGCVWGGRLTAWIAEEDRVLQVPAARAYAPLGS